MRRLSPSSSAWVTVLVGIGSWVTLPVLARTIVASPLGGRVRNRPRSSATTRTNATPVPILRHAFAGGTEGGFMPLASPVVRGQDNAPLDPGARTSTT